MCETLMRELAGRGTCKCSLVFTGLFANIAEIRALSGHAPAAFLRPHSLPCPRAVYVLHPCHLHSNSQRNVRLAGQCTYNDQFGFQLLRNFFVWIRRRRCDAGLQDCRAAKWGASERCSPQVGYDDVSASTTAPSLCQAAQFSLFPNLAYQSRETL
jgi:hypothetical protein